MFPSNVVFEEFVLRSLTYAFDKAFPGAWRVTGGEMCVLESFCRFEVRTHVKKSNVYTWEKKSYLSSFGCLKFFPHLVTVHGPYVENAYS